MIWYEWCFAQIKRERVRETMDQTLTTRYVSRFEPLALHPRLHHRVEFPIHYLPPMEPLPKRIFTTREYRTPLSNTASQPRGRPIAKQPQTPLPKRVTSQTPPLTRGSKPQPKSTSTKEGYHKAKGLQQGGLSQPHTTSFFHKTSDPIARIEW